MIIITIVIIIIIINIMILKGVGGSSVVPTSRRVEMKSY